MTTATTDTFAIGGDLPVHRLGYGAMQITGEGIWGPPADHDGALAVLRRAVELGVDFIDTADSYGPTISEELIAEALHPYPENLVIATKAGLTRTGPGHWHVLGFPEYLKQQCELSLRRLKVDIDRPLPAAPRRHPGPARRPARRPRGAPAEGKIRHIGLSEITVAQLQAALDDHAGRHGAEPLQRRQPGQRAAARRLRLSRHRLHPLVPGTDR